MVDSEIASYADDSTSFSADIDSRSVVDELEISFIILFTWINNNFIKYNNFNNYIRQMQTKVIICYQAVVTVQLILMETSKNQGAIKLYLA